MVALDHRGLAEAGFDDVRIDRALHKIIDGADLLGFGLKDADEFLADDLALRLRIGDAGELREEPILRVDADEVDIPFAEGGFDLVALILAHQAVVDKHAGQLAADGLGHQRCSDRRVHAAGQRQQRAAGADLFADGADGGLAVICHGPVAGGAADGIEEAAQNFAALDGVLHFRMELHAVELLFRAGHSGRRADGGLRSDGEAVGDLRDIVAVAHPRHGGRGQAMEDRTVCVSNSVCVLPYSRAVASVAAATVPPSEYAMSWHP